MQLLCRYDVNDFASWKEHFDADTEAQRDAGLSLLQIWQEHDTPSRVFCLFEVNDLDKARDFIDGPRARARSETDGVRDAACHILDTL
ncbi:MAG: hypothetical protein RID15_00215 [Marinovum algicola]|uniref:Uncharacterized protein n=1 Tax=Marinovum algicola TaxID=42444 RepID=A0A975ZN79_9RHOB|nr:hypothetical protein [Marinovum algicola]SEJ39432.1 hypothetical protein SAMN04487940_105208 [Marinovum algicola]SLN40532.1 hypothetical protein MAA5396_01955 [Marinovum algicola]